MEWLRSAIYSSCDRVSNVHTSIKQPPKHSLEQFSSFFFSSLICVLFSLQLSSAMCVCLGLRVFLRSTCANGLVGEWEILNSQFHSCFNITAAFVFLFFLFLNRSIVVGFWRFYCHCVQCVHTSNYWAKRMSSSCCVYARILAVREMSNGDFW